MSVLLACCLAHDGSPIVDEFVEPRRAGGSGAFKTACLSKDSWTVGRDEASSPNPDRPMRVQRLRGVCACSARAPVKSVGRVVRWHNRSNGHELLGMKPNRWMARPVNPSTGWMACDRDPTRAAGLSPSGSLATQGVRDGNGTTTFVLGCWPANHVGHQQEAVFVALQLMRALRASERASASGGSESRRRTMRLVYVAPSAGANANTTLRRPSARAYHVTRLEHITPFVLGLLSVFNVTLDFLALGPGDRICFEDAVMVQPKGSGKLLRGSHLVPALGGQLFVPTRRAADHFMRRVRAHCGLPTPTTGGNRTCTQAPRVARVLLRERTGALGRTVTQSGGERSLRNLDAVTSLLRRYVGRVDVVYLSRFAFCEQVGWYDADVVLSPHGSHLIASAFMPPSSHLVERSSRTATSTITTRRAARRGGDTCSWGAAGPPASAHAFRRPSGATPPRASNPAPAASARGRRTSRRRCKSCGCCWSASRRREAAPNRRGIGAR